MNWLPSEKIIEFLDEQDVKEKTRKNYRWILYKFFLWVSRRKLIPSELTRGNIIDYKQHLMRNDYSPFTINFYLDPVRSFFKWMAANGWHNNIAQGVRYLKKPPYVQKKIFKIDEWKKIIGNINQETKIGLRDYVLFQFMIYTGLRSIEVRNIRTGDYYKEDNMKLMKILAKGRQKKDTIIRIETELAEILDNYILRMKLKPEHPLFPNLQKARWYQELHVTQMRNIFVKRLEDAGINSKDYSIHCIRHTAAAWIMNQGGSVFDIQRFLRHSNPNTTMIYLKTLKYKLGIENKGGKIIGEILKN